MGDMMIRAAKMYIRNKHDAGRGIRYPAAVKAAVAKAIAAGRAAGATWAKLAKDFSLPLLTARRWATAAASPAPAARRGKAGANKGAGK